MEPVQVQRGALSGAAAAAASPSQRRSRRHRTRRRWCRCGRRSSAVRAGSGAAAAPAELTPREHATHSAAVATPRSSGGSACGQQAARERRQIRWQRLRLGTPVVPGVPPPPKGLALMLSMWQESFPCPLVGLLERSRHATGSCIRLPAPPRLLYRPSPVPSSLRQDERQRLRLGVVSVRKGYPTL